MARPRLWRWVLALGLPAAALAVYGCALVGGITQPLPIHCTNGAQDADEKGVDCGGSCASCTGEACATGDDCASELCDPSTKQCATPADTTLCFPGKTTDCRFCHTCDVNAACVFDQDCTSGLCLTGICTQCTLTGDPRCTDADAGPNFGCAEGPMGGICPAVTCVNQVMDNGETGVDCGGPCPNACGAPCDGGACADGGTDAGDDAGTDAGEDAGVDAGEDAGDDAGMDAGSDAGDDAGMDAGSDAADDAGGDAGDDAGMDAGSDAASLCGDGLKDGNETDVDCGGSCVGCGLDKACGADGDCTASNCVGKLCRKPGCLACSPTCGACPLSLCSTGADCWSNHCLLAVCQ